MTQQSHSWAFIPEKENRLTQNLHTNVNSSFIHYGQRLETSKIPSNRSMDKQTVVYLRNELLLKLLKQ